MQPYATIEHFSEEVKPNFDIRQRQLFAEIGLFGFQGFDTALGNCIVLGIPLSIYVDPEAVFHQHPHVVLGGIRHALVG
jgi:hypothetical protein